MVDDSRRQRVEVEVTHSVCPHHHCSPLFVERVDDALQRLRRRVEVIAVELHGEASAAVVDDSGVPASADAQVGAVGDDVHEAWVVVCFQQLCSAVGGMVVDDDDVVVERGFLRQCRIHRIADGLLPVVYRYDDRCLVLEILFLEVGRGITVGVHQCPNLPQVVGGSLLHLYLHLTVAWVHIVELFLSTCPEVEFLFGIQVFVQVQEGSLAADEEAQVVDARKLVLRQFLLSQVFVQQFRAYEEYRPEVEVVADAAQLVVDNRMLHRLAVFHGIVVGIDECRPCILGHPEEPFGGIHAEGDGSALREEHHEVGLCMLLHGYYGSRRLQPVDGQQGTVCRAVAFGLLSFTHEQVDMMYGLVGAQLAHCHLCHVHVVARQEAVDFSSHIA